MARKKPAAAGKAGAKKATRKKATRKKATSRKTRKGRSPLTGATAKLESELVRIRVKLPKDAPYQNESFWAKPVGRNLYELQNSPWYAFDLHFHDVVRATAPRPNDLPRITGVSRRSGHKTLRVVFPPQTKRRQRLSVLKALHHWDATYEAATDDFLAIDVPPAGDYEGLYHWLAECETAGLLYYETGDTSG